MGEIAEMMIDGTLDAETGEYLSDGPGYPRVQRGGKVVGQHEPNRINKLNGVINYLSHKGFTSKKQRRVLMEDFTGESNLSNKRQAELIQEDWGSFVGFVNSKVGELNSNQ